MRSFQQIAKKKYNSRFVCYLGTFNNSNICYVKQPGNMLKRSHPSGQIETSMAFVIRGSR